MMKTLARSRNGTRDASNEVEELREALDKSYAQLRERASREWCHHCAGADPSDACVHVHIGDSQQHALEV
jgi:hypothetical protein